MFCFRVDIDSRYGLLHGVPNLLDALSRNDAKASFFIPMGGESTLLELLRHRGGPRGGMAGVKLPKLEVARMILSPRDFAAENVRLLERIVAEGHSLGVHGFKHRAWTRSLDSIDAAGHVRMATERFKELMGSPPSTFAAPAFRTNSTVLDALDANGYAAAGDMAGEQPFHPMAAGRHYSCVQVPVNLKMPSTDPLVESYCLSGMSDSDAAAAVCRQIDEKESQGGYACFYCHDFFEGAIKPHVISSILAHVKRQGYEMRTVGECTHGVMLRREVAF